MQDAATNTKKKTVKANSVEILYVKIKIRDARHVRCPHMCTSIYAVVHCACAVCSLHPRTFARIYLPSSNPVDNETLGQAQGL